MLSKKESIKAKRATHKFILWVASPFETASANGASGFEGRGRN